MVLEADLEIFTPGPQCLTMNHDLNLVILCFLHLFAESFKKRLHILCVCKLSASSIVAFCGIANNLTTLNQHIFIAIS